MELLYFPLRGRAEIPRLILEDHKASYENVVPANWGEVKPKMVEDGTCPYGQMPVLVDGDLKVAQSNTIIRYLGRKYHLNGSSEADLVAIDGLIDHGEDVRREYLKQIYQNRLEAKALAEFFDNYLPVRLQCLEGIAKRNGSTGFLVGKTVTVADYTWLELLDVLLNLKKDLLDKYPLLKQLHKSMKERPNIVEYLASGRRPKMVNGNGLGC